MYNIYILQGDLSLLKNQLEEYMTGKGADKQLNFSQITNESGASLVSQASLLGHEGT